MPPRAERRKQKSDSNAAVMDLTIDGQTYRFDSSEITHRHELALWNQARLTMAEVFIALGQEKPAGFMVAALVFLSRVAEGDKVTFDEVAEAISLTESDIDVKIISGAEDDEPEDGRPEALAAG
jgi:hypothetical protein